MELRKAGITLSYDGKLFEIIAKNAMKYETGARELSNVVNYIFEDIIFNIMANPGKFSNCHLDLGIVDDNKRYKLS